MLYKKKIQSLSSILSTSPRITTTVYNITRWKFSIMSSITVMWWCYDKSSIIPIVISNTIAAAHF